MGYGFRRFSAARPVLALITIVFCGTLSASAQYSTIFSFPSTSSLNEFPSSTPIADSQGNLYGTTGFSVESPGGVYELTPAGDGTYTESFYAGFVSNGSNSDNGIDPVGVVLDPKSGNLYGATAGGGTGGCGLVYQLTPPSVNNGNWSETVLYNFACGDDGGAPYSPLIIDSAGRLYGTTSGGGASGFGTVFMLMPPSQAGGAWTEQVLHSFLGSGDGGIPQSALIMDSSGAVYGVTPYESVPNRLWGTAFKLTPTKSGPWAETVLHRFYGGQVSDTDGGKPIGPLALDGSGAVYGATEFGGAGCPSRVHTGCGTVFQLVPPATKGGAWTENLIYQFDGLFTGAAPESGVQFDEAGVLYGTTAAGGKNYTGEVFNLSPPSNGVGTWKIAVFPLPQKDYTITGVLLFENTYYGTSEYDGVNGTGSVFELQQ
jgi:uncharacterized repeat protein (TIGR03803 family)